jgi:hypothetical protein
MVDKGDVMRSDRLKQVILEFDSNFDEKTLGFTKFNRFVQEASNRGLLRLQKMENGQYEVGPVDASATAPKTEEERDDTRRGRSRRGRGGRGRDQDSRGPRDAGQQARQQDTPDDDEQQQPHPSAAEPSVAPVDDAAQPEQEQERPAASQSQSNDLKSSFDLLRRAKAGVASGNGIARDSDVKRRMLELETGWDESTLGFSKFSRFLRQAHDAEVINLRKMENGSYEVALPEAGDFSDGASGAGRPGRGRQQGRSGPRASEPARTPESVSEPSKGETRETTPAAPAQAAAEAKPAPAPAAPADDSALSRSLGLRRGSRGRPATAAPPPLLEGQTVSPRKTETAAPPSKAARSAEPASRPAPAPAAKRSRRGAAKRAAPVAAGFNAGALGLPSDAEAIMAHLASYKGVGRKSGETLVEAFGADGVFAALQNDPDRVKELLGARRGEALLEAWGDDYAMRLANSGADRKEAGSSSGGKSASASAASEEPAKRRSRGRRGGRRGKRGGSPAKAG